MRSPVRVVAVIPARAGSVGVPDKNLRTVGGVPLVQRAVRTALATASVDHVVVSTDGLEIASLAAEAGAGVVMRPAALSTGLASSESAITHTLDVLEERGAEPEVVVFLQSTSPFTRPEDVDAAVARVRSGECDSVFSAAQTHAFIWEVDARGAAYGVNHDPNVRRMRQDLAPQYRETGAFYVLDAQGYRRAGHRFFGRVGVAVVAEEIDIDTERDLALFGSGVTVTTVPGRMRLLDHDVDGDGILLTTLEGPGASGYVDRPVQIRREGFRLAGQLATLTVWDAAPFLISTRFTNGLQRVPTITNTSGGMRVTNDPDLAPLVLR